MRTRRHKSKGHQNSLETNSSTHESQERTDMKNDSTKRYKTRAQCHSEATARQDTDKGTILQFLKPSSNKTKVDSPASANIAHTCAQNTKRNSCETEPRPTQCSNKQQTTNTQEATGERQIAEGIFSDRHEELRLMTWNVMGTTTGYWMSSRPWH